VKSELGSGTGGGGCPVCDCDFRTAGWQVSGCISGGGGKRHTFCRAISVLAQRLKPGSRPTGTSPEWQ